MTSGIIVDGEFLAHKETEKATKCDACKDIVGRVQDSDIAEFERPMSENVDPNTFGLEDYSGYVDVCGDCIVEGIGEEGLENLKEVFEKE